MPLAFLGGYSIHFKGSLVLLLLLIGLGIFWAFLAYRRTLPPAPIFLRICLGSLRLAVLMALIFLIFEPTITRKKSLEQKPALVILIDDTQSMNLTDASGKRSEQLIKLFGDPTWDILKDQFRLFCFAAGDSLRNIQSLAMDSLQLKTIGTDLVKTWDNAVREIKVEECRGLILISDGGNNAGSDPVKAAEGSLVPIYTIGIGDTSEIIDSRIESIVGPEIAYKEKPIQLTVRVTAQGMKDQKASLELRNSDGKILSKSEIRLPADKMQSEESLEFTPEQIGRLPLQVNLVTSYQEWSEDNNERVFPLEVRESRIRLVIISGSPNFEAMFFEKAALKIPDVEATFISLRKEGQFYNVASGDLPNIIRQADVLVMMNFPSVYNPSPVKDQISRLLEQIPRPVWFFCSEKPSTKDLERICGGLPFQVVRLRSQSDAMVIPHRFYSILDPDAEASEFSQWWDLPPIRTPGYAVKLDPSAVELLQFKDPSSGENLGSALTVWEKGDKRFAFTFGSGWWRWNFISLGFGGSDEFFSAYLSRLLRWLAASPQKKPLRLSTDEKLISSGSSIQFSALVLGEDGRNISSANVDVTIEGPEGISKILLEPDPNGRYTGKFQPMGVGEYSFSGYARVAEDTVGIDRGSFLVESYNVEKETLNQNWALLQAVSHNSGGQYLPADSLTALVNYLNAEKITVIVSWERRFFLNWDLWILVIALLGLEWIIRKRRGML